MPGKIALFLYRIVASMALYGVLLGVVAFSSLLLVYAVDSEWVVPVVLSKEDPLVLDAEEKLVTTQEAIDSLQLDIGKSEPSIAEMKAHAAALAALYPQIEVAIKRETAAGRKDGARLDALDTRAQAGNLDAESALREVRSVEDSIGEDLRAGLITKGDAALQRAQVALESASAVTNEVDETLLRDTILQKTTVSTPRLEALDKRVDLKSQIETLRLGMAAAERQVETERGEVRQLQGALRLVRDTPAYSVLSGAKYFAFVPVENRKAGPGKQVYDCLLSFAWCKVVGQVRKVFTDEEHAENPIFKTQMRGFLIEIELWDEGAARSKTLFLGRPLLF